MLNKTYLGWCEDAILFVFMTEEVYNSSSVILWINLFDTCMIHNIMCMDDTKKSGCQKDGEDLLVRNRMKQ